MKQEKLQREFRLCNLPVSNKIWALQVSRKLNFGGQGDLDIEGNSVHTSIFVDLGPGIVNCAGDRNRARFGFIGRGGGARQGAGGFQSQEVLEGRGDSVQY